MNISPVFEFLLALDEMASKISNNDRDFTREVKNAMPTSNKFSEHFQIFQSVPSVKPTTVWIDINKKHICYFSMDYEYLISIGMKNFIKGDVAVVSYSLTSLDISAEVIDISARLTNSLVI